MRLVLLYTGKGPKPRADIQRIEAMPGVTVIDKSTPNIVIIEAPARVKAAVAAMPDWYAGKQTFFESPKPHPNF